MKKIFILTVISGVLFGCAHLNSSNKAITAKKNPEIIQLDFVDTKTAKKPEKLPGEGIICGGIEKIPCTMPLFCIFDENSSVGAGTCQNLIIDKDLDCETELFKQELPIKEPVCAQIGNQKHAFLNSCEAARRGATKAIKGFCKPDPLVKNNCQAKTVALGTCFNTTNAWEFDGQECIEKFVTGCTHEIPFETQSACEQQCK